MDTKIESIQVYDGTGDLPQEIQAIIEENEKLKKEIEGYEDTVERLQKEIKRLRGMDSGEGAEPYKNPYYVSFDDWSSKHQRWMYNENGH